MPNAGIRLTAADAALAYTGDTGPSPEIAQLAVGADVFLSDATYVEQVPDADAAVRLLTARPAGRYGRPLLTHLWLRAAEVAYGGPVDVAAPGLVVSD